MNPRRNPFAPGAGSRPPELAGREAALQGVAVALGRIRNRRHAQSVIGRVGGRRIGLCAL